MWVFVYSRARIRTRHCKVNINIRHTEMTVSKFTRQHIFRPEWGIFNDELLTKITHPLNHHPLSYMLIFSKKEVTILQH